MRIEDRISTRYKDAGVDAAAAGKLVDAIKPLARATRRLGATAVLGGFGGLFDLKALHYRDPLLVAATDGVGTKLKLAIELGRHDTIGIDLVAMCVNDLVVHGAEPLFFLDYFATARLDGEVARSVIAGIADGCRTADCALIGGETAEMPGMYQPGDYDLAGFAVGIVERDNVLPRTQRATALGDVVIGLASSGVHSNGFSLVRTLIEESGLTIASEAPFELGSSLGKRLLTPTKIYVRSCLSTVGVSGVKAFVHITMGGIRENLARVLPSNCTAFIAAERWPLQPVFRWLRQAGNIAPLEMFDTFNCGIGMAAIVAPDAVERVSELLRQGGETVHVVGEIVSRGDDGPAVVIANPEAPWQD